MARRLKVDSALRALPEVDDLSHLREALIGVSREDVERAWASSEAYATLDTRLADTAALEAQLSALAERARVRVERVMRHSVAALRALEAGDEARAARALVSAGEEEEEEGRLGEAEAFYRQALTLGRRPRDRSAEGLALRRLGRVARERGELEKAARLYRQGFDVAVAQRDGEGAVVACQGLGNVAVDQGLWDEARGWYARGIELVGEGRPSRLLWQLQSNLAVVALRTGALEESRDWLEAAGEVSRALRDDAARLPLGSGWGRLHVAEGRLEAAESAYRGALAGAASPLNRGAVLVNLAECLLLRGRLHEAERTVREAERLAVVHRVTPLLPYVYRGLGAVARARGDDEGFVFYEQALDLCHESGTPPVELATTQHEYALLDRDQGRLDLATARLREAIAIYRRLGTRAELARAEAELAALRGEGGGNEESGEAAASAAPTSGE